jgi:hypothetical protein
MATDLCLASLFSEVKFKIQLGKKGKKINLSLDRKKLLTLKCNLLL